MKETIKAILDKIILDEDYINSEDLIDEDYIDSYDLVLLVSELNKAFNIEIIMKDILPDNFKSINTIAELVEHYQSK